MAPPRRDRRDRRRALPGRLRRLVGVQPRQHAAAARSVIPTHVTLAQLRQPAAQQRPDERRRQGRRAVPAAGSSTRSIVAGATALFTTMLGALAAYAFSRFRFKGRRMGMLALLLIQMFPQLARRRRDLPDRPATSATSSRPIGLNTLLAADPRLPRRRDGREHLADEGLLRHDPDGARRVGARRRRDAGADLLGRRPAARGAGARRRRADLVRLHAQRVRDRVARCSRRTTTSRCRVGMHGFIDQQYGEHWGPFAAGVAAGGDPGRRSSSCSCSSSSSAASRGRGQGMSVTESSVRHRCSTSRTTTARTSTSSSGPTSSAARRSSALRVPRAHGVDARRCCATCATASRAASRRTIDEETETDVWWRATFPVANPVDALPLAAHGRRAPATRG